MLILLASSDHKYIIHDNSHTRWKIHHAYAPDNWSIHQQIGKHSRITSQGWYRTYQPTTINQM